MNFRKRRCELSSVTLFIGLSYCWLAESFLAMNPSSGRQRCVVQIETKNAPMPHSESSSTARSAWWTGSEAMAEIDNSADPRNFVSVRIERTSANSRRIRGEVAVPVPIQDVWAILTDYNRLAIHVPNLVESRIEKVSSGGEMGDGQFQCRLFQKGAQKIIGFEFGASVTMDMKEVVMARYPPVASAPIGNERKVTFKCVDSFFFQEFDGEWKVQERTSPDGSLETLLSYVVDVRPRGPVPVAALEWRIREDVPTNLLAVKTAALDVGYNGIMAARGIRPSSTLVLAHDPRVKVQWYKDETMAAYLTDG